MARATWQSSYACDPIARKATRIVGICLTPLSRHSVVAATFHVVVKRVISEAARSLGLATTTGIRELEAGGVVFFLFRTAVLLSFEVRL